MAVLGDALSLCCGIDRSAGVDVFDERIARYLSVVKSLKMIGPAEVVTKPKPYEPLAKRQRQTEGRVALGKVMEKLYQEHEQIILVSI
ncbi:hypothetical protein ColTof4_14424 [Colletotrichum tofieldiae]|nr:hypothetical protein ColTof4_14424 [Colletotrichum tofieldiae]